MNGIFTTNDGVNYGATNGIQSSGNFRNYGGSVEVLKGEPVTIYKLKYSAVNPYNTLPN